MIGWIVTGIVDQVLTPQAAVVDVTRRAFLDPDARPLNAEAQELEIRAASTRPVSYEIGDGLEVDHVVVVGLVVEHGGQAEAKATRDAITLDLVLRLIDVEPTLRQLVGPGPQYVTRIVWALDYAPLIADTPNEWATLTITVTAQVDR